MFCQFRLFFFVVSSFCVCRSHRRHCLLRLCATSSTELSDRRTRFASLGIGNFKLNEQKDTENNTIFSYLMNEIEQTERHRLVIHVLIESKNFRSRKFTSKLFYCHNYTVTTSVLVYLNGLCLLIYTQLSLGLNKIIKRNARRGRLCRSRHCQSRRDDVTVPSLGMAWVCVSISSPCANQSIFASLFLRWFSFNFIFFLFSPCCSIASSRLVVIALVYSILINYVASMTTSTVDHLAFTFCQWINQFFVMAIFFMLFFRCFFTFAFSLIPKSLTVKRTIRLIKRYVKRSLRRKKWFFF